MRTASITRNTKETQIALTLNLDGQGKSEVNTGIGFLDHMLTSFARHGLFDLTVEVHGDLEVDSHHTIEDTGIVLGTAIAQAVGDKKGIVRFGSVILPAERVGTFETEMVREFFYAVSYTASMNLHIRELAGSNTHHLIEAIYKAFAKALDAATTTDPRIADVLSTKGSL